MHFGTSTSAMLETKRGKVVQSEEKELLNRETMKSIEEEKGYKFLGVHWKRKNGIKGLISLEECIATEKTSLDFYLKKQKRLLTEVVIAYQ